MFNKLTSIKSKPSKEELIQTQREDLNIRVLHIDDSEAILTISKTFIERYGDGQIRVDSLEDPKKTLEMLKTESYDVIISDHYMHKYNGIELLEEVRGAGITLPFIIFTGIGRPEEIIEALNSGVDYVIYKGSEVRKQYKDLVDAINKIVKKTRTLNSLK